MGLGLELSLRTVQRVWRGEVRVVGAVSPTGAGDDTGKKKGDRRKVEDGPIEEGPGEEGPVLVVGEEERGGVADIIRRAARASFLEVGELQLESRPGEISVRVRVYEPEENYE